MDHYKLRLKDPSGAEFEAEGTAEFILNEKASFLFMLQVPEDLKHKNAAPGQRTAPDRHDAPLKADFWDKVVSLKNDLIELRTKSPEIGAAEAALILLAANRALNGKEDLGAMTLSRALKTSGYEPDRLDRLLSKEIREGRATASGTKRNRTYRLTQKGLEKAYLAIKKLK